MERRQFNVLKHEILEILKDGSSHTSSQISSKVNSQKTNTCDAMLRLLDQGLVTREPLLQNRVGRPRFEYKVSPRGLGRLEYLKAQKARTPTGMLE
jgi:predicted transcriptional regulator